MFIAAILALPVLSLPRVLSSSNCGSRDYSGSSQPVTLSQTTFIGCTSEGDGGAIYIKNANAVFQLVNCHFEECRSRAKGGCIYFEGDSASIFDFFGVNCSAEITAFASLYFPSSKLRYINSTTRLA
jgi:hypothetical protein